MATSNKFSHEKLRDASYSQISNIVNEDIPRDPDLPEGQDLLLDAVANIQKTSLFLSKVMIIEQESSNKHLTNRRLEKIKTAAREAQDIVNKLENLMKTISGALTDQQKKEAAEIIREEEDEKRKIQKIIKEIKEDLRAEKEIEKGLEYALKTESAAQESLENLGRSRARLR